MALILNVTKQDGAKEVEVNYWEIVEFYAKPVEKYFVCELRGYQTKEDYSEYLNTGVNKEEFKFRFSLSGPDYPDTTQADWVYNTVETYIKMQSNKYGIDWTAATKEK